MAQTALQNYDNVCQALDIIILTAAQRMGGDYDLTRYIELIIGLAKSGKIDHVSEAVKSTEGYEFYETYRELTDNRESGSHALRCYHSTIIFKVLVSMLLRTGYTFYVDEEYLVKVVRSGTIVGIGYWAPKTNDTQCCDVWDIDLKVVLFEIQRRIDWVATGNSVTNYPVRQSQNRYINLKDVDNA